MNNTIYENKYPLSYFTASMISLGLIAILGVFIISFPSSGQNLLTVFSLVGGLFMNLLEFVIPSILILLRWDAFEERPIVRILTIGVLVFGVIVSLWCTIANIVYISY